MARSKFLQASTYNHPLTFVGALVLIGVPVVVGIGVIYRRVFRIPGPGQLILQS